VWVLGHTAVKLLEAIRDRLIQRSLIGKRKLDRSVTRRELDVLLRELGERWRALVKAGRLEVPAELAPLVERVKSVESRLEAQERDIEALQNEEPSTT
jgi:hypothetical protein